MPLVAHNNLPTFERLREEGCQVLSKDAAQHQDIRALHVGLLNMMPDLALEATERQFFRLLDGANRVVQIHVHAFTVESLDRSEASKRHIDKHYKSFDELREMGLDALIITGANVTKPDLTLEPFWDELCAVVDWAAEHVTSVFCSCLATHAVWQHRYNIKRRHLDTKCWGVFEHHAIESQHPLVKRINTRFCVPHSRFNTVDPKPLATAGMHILVASDQIGVLLAVSEDGFRFVFSQGHPEYDTTSLLKEYKRELGRFVSGEREDYPPFVDNYFSRQSRAILREHEAQVREALVANWTIPELPENLLIRRLDNVWRDTAHVIMANWIGKVYLLTHADRKLPFMDGIDAKNPLGLYPSAS
ncbi:MAG: homoserine O-succinyltransferase MetA [Granulosicoccaceae bacterium]